MDRGSSVGSSSTWVWDFFYQIEMSVLEILNIGSAAAGVTSLYYFSFVKYQKATGMY